MSLRKDLSSKKIHDFRSPSLRISNEKINFHTTTESYIEKIEFVDKLLYYSEGKNKLLCFLQYASKIISNSIVYSIDTTLLLDQSQNLEALYSKHFKFMLIEKSISNSRKIFRFLKFIEFQSGIK